jgi:hypothetical protein
MVVGVSRVGKDRFGAPCRAAFTPGAGGDAAAGTGWPVAGTSTQQRAPTNTFCRTRRLPLRCSAPKWTLHRALKGSVPGVDQSRIGAHSPDCRGAPNSMPLKRWMSSRPKCKLTS